MNFYVTTEPITKLNTIISNIKSFYILDIQAFVKSFDLDLRKPSNIYYINTEIENEINQKSKLKKYHGIIYINKNLDGNIIKSLQTKFQKNGEINKIVLLDNSVVPKHYDLHSICDEIYFYEPFCKNKIIECKGLYKDEDGNTQLNINV